MSWKFFFLIVEIILDLGKMKMQEHDILVSCFFFRQNVAKKPAKKPSFFQNSNMWSLF